MANYKNINRDYIVEVDVKNSTVSASNNIMFYITDKNTSNIYFKLKIDEPESGGLVYTHGQKENSDDYKLVLRVIKPNDELKQINVTRRDKNSNIFIADLPADYTDYIGTYTCELFIKTDIVPEEGGEPREEISTTNSFTYEVVASIANNLDGIIESDDRYPLFEDLMAQLKDMDINGLDLYATQEYVKNHVSSKIWIGTQEEYDELYNSNQIKNDILYLIEEED